MFVHIHTDHTLDWSTQACYARIFFTFTGVAHPEEAIAWTSVPLRDSTRPASHTMRSLPLFHLPIVLESAVRFPLLGDAMLKCYLHETACRPGTNFHRELYLLLPVRACLVLICMVTYLVCCNRSFSSIQKYCHMAFNHHGCSTEYSVKCIVACWDMHTIHTTARQFTVMSSSSSDRPFTKQMKCSCTASLPTPTMPPLATRFSNSTV